MFSIVTAGGQANGDDYPIWLVAVAIDFAHH